MSLIFLVFIAVPVVAPSLGQGIILVAPWQWIFGVLAAFTASLAVWAFFRLPETLPAAARRPFEVPAVLSAYRIALTTRTSIGYAIATTLVLGGLFGFINSAQQIFVDIFDLGPYFPLAFAAIAFSIAIASFLNSRIVERIGMRIVSHAALLGFTGVAVAHALVAITGLESFAAFLSLQAALLFCFGLTMGNFGAMAMEKVGHIAGTASSLQGFISTLGGALLGFAIGQQFDGTVIPLTFSCAVLGVLAIAAVLITERGRLFRSTTAALR